MLLLLILLVVGVGLGYYYGKKEGGGVQYLLAFLGLTISLVVFFIVGVIIENKASYEQQYSEYDKVELVALTNSGTIEGGFSGVVFVFGGRIESVPYYFFYYKTPDGGKKLGKLHAEAATIYEEKRIDAYMSQVKKKKIYKNLNKLSEWLLPKLLQSEPISTGEYAIHVPEGTIKREINLDLKNLK